jgi:hypothetical protein
MSEQPVSQPTIDQKLDIMYDYLVSVEAKLDYLIRLMTDEEGDDADISPFGGERDQGQTL